MAGACHKVGVRAVTVEIVYETHSISTDNERGIATGWLPGELSNRGRELAAELGARRRADNIAAVFTSDLRRAVETCEIAFGGSGIPIHQDARLRECNYGALNGMPVAKVTAERSRHIQVPFPEGESYQDAAERMRGFLTEIFQQWDETRILIVGHSATRWALQHLLEGVPLADLVDAPFAWQAGWRFRLRSPDQLARPR